MEVSHHTKIKHRLLRQYLTICHEVHKKDPLKFYYFETHAGDGIAKYPDRLEDGSALMAAKKLSDSMCIFVELGADENGHYNKLAENLNGFNNVTLIEGNCNQKIEDVLNIIPKYYHSFGFLDPYAPSQLKWSTIQKIVDHSYEYRDKPMVRRPELLINFPLKRFFECAGHLRNIDIDAKATSNVKFNTEFIGSEEWIPLWEKREAEEITSEDFRDAILKIFLRRMNPYYKYHYYTLVEEFRSQAPLYYLIFFTNHSLASKVLRDLKLNIEKWKKEEYIRDVYKISMPIDEFIQESAPKKSKVNHSIEEFLER